MKKITLSLALVFGMFFTGCQKEELIVPEKPAPTEKVGTGCTSVQCYATAKSTGNRCKNKTTYCNGRCYAHQ